MNKSANSRILLPAKGFRFYFAAIERIVLQKNNFPFIADQYSHKEQVKQQIGLSVLYIPAYGGRIASELGLFKW